MYIVVLHWQLLLVCPWCVSALVVGILGLGLFEATIHKITSLNIRSSTISIVYATAQLVLANWVQGVVAANASVMKFNKLQLQVHSE